MENNAVAYRVIRSRRKTLGIQIVSPTEVLIRAPLHMSEKEIRSLLATRQSWIESHLAAAARQEEFRKSQPTLTMEEIRSLADRAMTVLPPLVRQRAAEIGVRFGRITIRNQRTRWGSCSSAGNLNFNCLLMLCPDHVVDYVVVHELCHRLEMNHSPRFWSQVARILPDYSKSVSWLKENGPAVLARMGE